MIVSIAYTACWDTSLGVGGWGVGGTVAENLMHGKIR